VQCDDRREAGETDRDQGQPLAPTETVAATTDDRQQRVDGEAEDDRCDQSTEQPPAFGAGPLAGGLPGAGREEPEILEAQMRTGDRELDDRQAEKGVNAAGGGGEQDWRRAENRPITARTTYWDPV
jgi:hypothetical protein